MPVRDRSARRLGGPLAAVILSALVGAAAAPAQEPDNAIFHYTRLELDATRAPGATIGSWDATGWIGTDFDRLWWRTFGERSLGAFSEGEAQLLYGRYVRTFWDVVVGYRQEFRPTGTGFLAAGIQGVAPYWFDASLLAFLSQRGNVGARFEVDTDWFLTQRLIIRPAARIDWDASTDPRRQRPAGFNYREVGLRLRYEVERKFAPYVDLHYISEAGLEGTAPPLGESDGLRIGAGVWLIW